MAHVSSELNSLDPSLCRDQNDAFQETASRRLGKTGSSIDELFSEEEYDRYPNLKRPLRLQSLSRTEMNLQTTKGRTTALGPDRDLLLPGGRVGVQTSPPTRGGFPAKLSRPGCRSQWSKPTRCRDVREKAIRSLA